MPSFRTGDVVEILSERWGLQRLSVTLEGDEEPSRALNYTQVLGPVAVGDPVVCNTTAVELGLGTGGWHVVHWNLARRSVNLASGGHVMKSRYTSAQLDVKTVEEQGAPHHEVLAGLRDVDGMPVVVAGLHSHLAAIAGAFAAASEGRRLVYVMTDAASLPLALSDLVSSLRQAGLVEASITTGQAFGGDLEAVTVASALVAARHICGADAAVVCMGPGVVGTGTPLGFSALEVASVMDSAAGVGGRPIAALRVSTADGRDRHAGVSHHSLSALTFGSPGRRNGEVVVPAVGDAQVERIRTALHEAGVHQRYEIVEEAPGEWRQIMDANGIEARSMGRGIDDDLVFWAAAAAAGARAGALAKS